MTCLKVRIPCHSNNVSRVLTLLPSSPRPGRVTSVSHLQENHLQQFLKCRINKKIIFLDDDEVLLSLKMHIKHSLPFHWRNSTQGRQLFTVLFPFHWLLFHSIIWTPSSLVCIVIKISFCSSLSSSVLIVTEKIPMRYAVWCRRKTELITTQCEDTFKGRSEEWPRGPLWRKTLSTSLSGQRPKGLLCQMLLGRI